MAQITITINSREYPIACEDGQELRIMQLANVLDEKAKLLAGDGSQISESLLLAMVGLLLADEGKIDVLGFNPQKQKDELNLHIGYMPQKFGLYEDLTVIENLKLYADLKN